ncbi:hypothetical protein [Pseudorhodoferax sp. Leaf267]|nr:hypothetical protein [Pseudorhodoferax sp. Leaf267]
MSPSPELPNLEGAGLRRPDLAQCLGHCCSERRESARALRQRARLRNT